MRPGYCYRGMCVLAGCGCMQAGMACVHVCGEELALDRGSPERWQVSCICSAVSMLLLSFTGPSVSRGRVMHSARAIPWRAALASSLVSPSGPLLSVTITVARVTLVT